MNENSYQVLNKVNVSEKIKEKIGLRYLSWADAWGILKNYYPDASMKVYTREMRTTEKITYSSDNETHETVNESVAEVPYFTDGKTCFVKVGVTINDVEYVEYLPVMDNRNNAIAASLITMTAVNKAIQRAFVKACARHGLGLYVYAGEDLPEAEKKVIDYAAIAEKTERINTVVLSQDGFDQMKQSVINNIQGNYPKDASEAIIGYVTKTSRGKRLSLFTLEEDSQILQRIDSFINEVKKQLAAPSK